MKKPAAKSKTITSAPSTPTNKGEWNIGKYVDHVAAELRSVIVDKYGHLFSQLAGNAAKCETWKAKFLSLETAQKASALAAIKDREHAEAEKAQLQAKLDLEKEIDRNSQVQLDGQGLQDEIENLKFSLESAKKSQAAARQELARVLAQL
ncbi:hypothetical protein R1flu_014507 [Riccia fluitans]|uniref:Uncharacterized protein n=1 Tax=Riccia fluitans TaxID=41844 RepID=A0ABD1YGA7_9MARC